MKYPKYNRKQNLRCKLSDDDIQNIRSQYKEGNTITFIAPQYRVSPSTIWRCVISDEERKRLDGLSNSQRQKVRTKDGQVLSLRKWYQRKREIQLGEFNKYQKINNQNYIKLHPKKKSEWNKNFRIKHFKNKNSE